MLRSVHGEMKRIQGLKCPADIEMVKEHSQALKDLDKRTIRIEAGIAVTIFLIMALGGWEYFKDKEAKKAQAKADETYSIAKNK